MFKFAIINKTSQWVKLRNLPGSKIDIIAGRQQHRGTRNHDSDFDPSTTVSLHRFFGFPTLAFGAFVFLTVVGNAGETRGVPDLRVRLWADEIELTGALPDLRTAHAVRQAVARALPGKVVYDRLSVDAVDAPLDLPPLEDLGSLLFELGLSTVDGNLTIGTSQISVSGLTDSQVTHAAFDARLGILSKRNPGRTVFNRICIVTPEDLALPQPIRPRAALRPRPLGAEPVQIAKTDESDYGPPLPPVVATPVVMAATPVPPADLNIPEQATVPAPPAIPMATAFEVLEPVKFEKNTYLVTFSQHDLIGNAAALAKQLPAAAGKVVLRGYPDHPGRYDYNDWLCRERANAVKRLFVEAGLKEDRLIVDSPKNFKAGDRFGSVLILIPKVEEALAEATPP